MAAPVLVRFFSLAGAVDADPLILQPAADALGPLTTGFGGAILINAWEVDAAGTKVAPTPAQQLTVGVVTLSSLQTPPPAGGDDTTNKFWGRGPLTTLVEPGHWLIETELGEVVGFTVIVTAKLLSPAGRWLAIYAARGPRQ